MNMYVNVGMMIKLLFSCNLEPSSGGCYCDIQNVDV